MRQLRLLAFVGAAWALTACHDTISQPAGPDTALALHFDSLSAQANAASLPNRVAALDLILRALADGTLPGTLILSNGLGNKDTITYNTASWSVANVITKPGGDSVTDSLIVFLGWRGGNADTMVVLRSGDTKLAPQVESELSTLGLLAHLAPSDTTDTLTSAGLVTGNAVAVADSGFVRGAFGVFGAPCKFVTVTSVTNDQAEKQCNRELLQWDFGVRFSPSARLGLTTQAFSPGVVLVR